jgi:hypothetical protein
MKREMVSFRFSIWWYSCYHKVILGLMFLFLGKMAFGSGDAAIFIDLDRNTAGIQGQLDVPITSSEVTLLGAVVVLAGASEVVEANVFEVLLVPPPDSSLSIQPGLSTLSAGDLPGSIEEPAGILSATGFYWINPVPVSAAVGEDGILLLALFDLQMVNLPESVGQTAHFQFRTTLENESLGITLSGQNYCFGGEGTCQAVMAIGAEIRMVPQQPT